MPAITDTDAAELVTEFTQAANRDREAVAEKYAVYSEMFKPLILGRIARQFHDPESKVELSKFADITVNPALDITRQLCVLWKNPVKRSIASKRKQTEALQALYRESWIDSLAPRWNQIAFLVGPVIVVPFLNRVDDRPPVMTWMTLLPHQCLVVRDPLMPLGVPHAVCWHAEGVDFNYVVLDGDSWRYYNVDNLGRTLLVRKDPHFVGEFPGAVLRLDVPFDGSWLGPDSNRRLIDGTLSIGVVNATLNHVRKAQNRKLLLTVGNFEQVPRGQKLDPEAAVLLPAQSISDVSMQALDFDTDPNNFISHAMWTYQSLAEAYGAVSTPDMSNGRFTFSFERLTEARNEQLPFARAFEHDLAWKMVAVAKEGGHPLAISLSVEATKENFTAEFAKLSRSYSDPMKEIEHVEALMKLGAFNHLEFLRMYHPGLTDEQLKLKLLENIEEQIEFNDKVASRNLSTQPGEGRIIDAAQANGQMGGRPLNTPDGENDNGTPR